MSFIEIVVVIAVGGLISFTLIDRICSAIEKCKMYGWYSTVGWPDDIDEKCDCTCGEKEEVDTNS